MTKALSNLQTAQSTLAKMDGEKAAAAWGWYAERQLAKINEIADHLIEGGHIEAPHGLNPSAKEAISRVVESASPCVSGSQNSQDGQRSER